MIAARINMCYHRSTLPGYSFLGIVGTCMSTNRPSRTSAGTPGCLHIGIGQLVTSPSLPERSKTHDSQTLLTFSNHHFGRTRILKVDWAVGAIRIPIIACLMEVSGRFISRILRLIRYAGTSHSDRSGTFLRHSIYSSRNL